MKSLTHYTYEKYWNNKQVKIFERININKTSPCIILKWIIFQGNEKKKDLTCFPDISNREIFTSTVFRCYIRKYEKVLL